MLGGRHARAGSPGQNDAAMNPARWHRVTEVFHAALGREPEERRAFISRSCKDDPSLSEDVETLIAVHESAPFLDQTVAMAGMPRLDPGTLHGDYRIEEWIGAGGSTLSATSRFRFKSVAR
jgi:eukaryotic-like serine/threonine-protein kinase